jgi:phosphoenolpyruvate phosphomutase
MTDQATSLRRLLQADRPVVLAGAHDALSARLVEEAAFEGVWASGFEISASRGVPDASVLTMTDMLEAAQRMAAAVEIPIVADCDGAFGNAINAIHMIRAYERAGIAGVCIEDSTFPKRCSLYDDTRRELADIDEQALKIRAACDARRTPAVVIARTEAFVARTGLADALTRATAYAEAGADCILVHSTRDTAEEVLSFAEKWPQRVPLVAVPTTYSGIHVNDLWSAGFRMVIFANHGLRAAIQSVRETMLQLRTTGCAAAIESRVVPLAEVFDLVGLGELRDDERRYLHRGVRIPR